MSGAVVPASVGGGYGGAAVKSAGKQRGLAAVSAAGDYNLVGVGAFDFINCIDHPHITPRPCTHRTHRDIMVGAQNAGIGGDSGNVGKNIGTAEQLKDKSSEDDMSDYFIRLDYGNVLSANERREENTP